MVRALDMYSRYISRGRPYPSIFAYMYPLGWFGAIGVDCRLEEGVVAVFAVDVQTDYYQEYVTNRYHVLADDMAQAGVRGLAIANIQKSLLPVTNNIDYVRVSTITPGDNLFYTQQANIPGTRGLTSQTMPPFCRWRCDMNVGFRRPLRKYLLIPYEEDSEGSSFTSTAITFFNTNYAAPLFQLGYVCAEDGTVIIGVSLNSQIGMRQLRRGSRRRATPII